MMSQRLFGELRSLLHREPKDIDWRRNLWALIFEQATERRAIYESQWMPYLQSMPHRYWLAPLCQLDSIAQLEKACDIAPFASFSLSVTTHDLDILAKTSCIEQISELFLSGRIDDLNVLNTFNYFCDSLRCLSIEGGKLRPESLKELLSIDWKCLTHLGIKGNRLAPDENVKVCEVLGSSLNISTLNTLTLDDNFLIEEAVEALCHASWMPQITNLSLARCGLNSDRLNAFLNTMPLAQVKSLNLNGNHLRDEGVICLAKYDELAHLESLSIGENEITNQGIQSLVDGAFFDHLYVLNIHGNDVETKGLQYIFNVRSSHLQVLNICENDFSPSDFDWMVESPLLHQLRILILGESILIENSTNYKNNDITYRSILKFKQQVTKHHLNVMYYDERPQWLSDIEHKFDRSNDFCVDFSDGDAPPEDEFDLLFLWPKWPSVRHLKLPTYERYEQFFDYISSSGALGRLNELQIDGYIGDVRFKSFCEQSGFSGHTLHLHGTDITDSGIEALSHSDVVKNLRCLDLLFNDNLFNNGVAPLLQLNQKKSLQSMYLTPCTQRNVMSLLTSPNMRQLDTLSCCEIESDLHDVDWSPISVEVSFELRSLWLSWCEVHDEMAKFLASLKHLTSLKSFVIETSSITNSGLKYLLQAPWLGTIEHLSFINCGFDEQSIRLFTEANIPNLERLDFSNNDLDVSHLNDLREFAQFRDVDIQY